MVGFEVTVVRSLMSFAEFVVTGLKSNRTGKANIQNPLDIL